MRVQTAVAAASLILLSLSGALGASPSASLTRGELRWLGRVTFGIDSATVADYRRLGRQKFLDAQLHPQAADPADLAAAITAIPVTGKSAEAQVKAMRAEQQRVNSLPEEPTKQMARMALNQAGNQAIYETSK